MRAKINNMASPVVAGPEQVPGAAPTATVQASNEPDLISMVEKLSEAMIELNMNPNLAHDDNVVSDFRSLSDALESLHLTTTEEHEDNQSDSAFSGAEDEGSSSDEDVNLAKKKKKHTRRRRRGQVAFLHHEPLLWCALF